MQHFGLELLGDVYLKVYPFLVTTMGRKLSAHAGVVSVAVLERFVQCS